MTSARRSVQALIVMGVLLLAGARAMAEPVGPIDVSGSAGPVRAAGAADPAGHALAGATLGYGLDVRGRVDRVTVRRSAADTDAPVTVVLRDGDGRTLATGTARLAAAHEVVTLDRPVEPGQVAGAAIVVNA